MNLNPQRESAYFLLDDKGLPVVLIRNKILYAIDPLDDDGIVSHIFNGGDVLPLVQAGLASKPV